MMWRCRHELAAISVQHPCESLRRLHSRNTCAHQTSALLCNPAMLLANAHERGTPGKDSTKYSAKAALKPKCSIMAPESRDKLPHHTAPHNRHRPYCDESVVAADTTASARVDTGAPMQLYASTTTNAQAYGRALTASEAFRAVETRNATRKIGLHSMP